MQENSEEKQIPWSPIQGEPRDGRTSWLQPRQVRSCLGAWVPWGSKAGVSSSFQAGGMVLIDLAQRSNLGFPIPEIVDRLHNLLLASQELPEPEGRARRFLLANRWRSSTYPAHLSETAISALNRPPAQF